MRVNRQQKAETVLRNVNKLCEMYRLHGSIQIKCLFMTIYLGEIFFKTIVTSSKTKRGKKNMTAISPLLFPNFTMCPEEMCVNRLQ